MLRFVFIGILALISIIQIEADYRPPGVHHEYRPPGVHNEYQPPGVHHEYRPPPVHNEYRPPPVHNDYRPSVEPVYPSNVYPHFQPRVEPVYQPDVHADYRPKMEPEYGPKVEPIYQPKEDPTYRPKVKAEYQPKAEAGYQPKVEPEYQPKVEPEYQPKVESEYKPKAEAEYKTKVEYDYQPEVYTNRRLGDVINDYLVRFRRGKPRTLNGYLSVLDDKKNIYILWNVFKDYLAKYYEKTEEDKQRSKIFVDNLRKIVTANYHFDVGLQSYNLEMNRFGDLDEKEFGQKYTGYRIREDSTDCKDPVKPDNYYGYKKKDMYKKPYNVGKLFHRLTKRQVTNVPAHLDYQPYLNPVENQNGCESCYAFAAAGAVEGAYAVKKGLRFVLSKQEIVDCGLSGASGCKPGFPKDVFEYIKERGGLVFNSTYPYSGNEQVCTVGGERKGNIRGYGRVDSNDEVDMMVQLNIYGPLTVALNSKLIQFLSADEKNVFDSSACETKQDHAVIIVGYGNEDGQDYWLARNSWGGDWAAGGYFKIARNKNMCGIAGDVYYVLL